jgi:calnexin
MIDGTQVPAYFGLSTQTLVLQYETRYSGDADCSHAYIRLFSRDNFSPVQLCNETRSIITFGPDQCGMTDKVHFTFRQQDPLSGNFEEKHLTHPPKTKNDTLTHLWTLIVRPDHSFEVLIDVHSVRNGSLLQDFPPPVIPLTELYDSDDQKPSDWVDVKEIDDPEAKEPADWNLDSQRPVDDWLDNEYELVLENVNHQGK